MSTSYQGKVDGMTCGNCALTITKFLEKEGAESVMANSATGEVSFTVVEADRIEPLLQGIDKLGYKVLKEENGVVQKSSSVKYMLFVSLIFWIPLIAHMFISWMPLHNPWVQLILATPVYAIGVYHFGISAWRSLVNKLPNMDVLVFIGATAAYFYSITGWYLFPGQVHDYLFFETTASIITLVLAGNFLEEYTSRSTASAIHELMKYQKTKAKIIFTDSIGKETIQEVDNEFVRVDDMVLINTGDKIPADGIIVSGQASVDESMMNGESLPDLKMPGDAVIGGTIVTDGSIRMKTTAVGANTALSAIIQLVNQAQASKPPMQKMADKISAIFVPAVLVIAVLTFLGNYYFAELSMQQSMMRTIAVMVIACPCAMGLATPAAVMVGMGRAAKNGILVKGGDTLEKFTSIKQFVFDKTGTLTTGELMIAGFHTSMDEQEFKNVVVSAEQHSSHPIAKSILREWTSSRDILWSSVEEFKGVGLTLVDEQQVEWQVGSYRILKEQTEGPRHDLYLVKQGEPVGWIDLKDELRPGAAGVIQKLNAQGYRTIMLSGDRTEKCERIAGELKITEVYSEQLPHQKLEKLDELLAQSPTVMVGDGINDAPSLAKATIGISLSDASHIAMQSAHVILLKNNLAALPMAIGLGKHTFLTIKQNLFWAFFYNIVAIPVAAFGFLTPTWGAGIMGLSDVVLILNSLKLRFKKV
ncbi:MAG: cadmium-translocating P-type ATPase [Chitinophagaceae bacterium]|nr:cadmium-translocating P-type ATPase [Chitinophagaceae bacterium]